MSRWLHALRLAAVCGVIAAVVDPGCARPSRPLLELTIAGDVPREQREAATRQMRALTSWADLVSTDAAEAVRADARLLVGDAAPVLAELRARPAVLAARLGGEALEIGSLHLPGRVPSGTSVPITVRMDPTFGPRSGRVRVSIVDAATGLEQSSAESAIGSGADQAVTVSWLAVGTGTRRLRFRAAPVAPTGGRPSPWVETTVDLLPPDASAHLLEARPTWVGRFTRLALTAAGDANFSVDVRTAPGVSIRRQSQRAAGESDADVLLVSGVEALTARDVDRLESRVREAGRALVLLLDEAPGSGAWRRLWPGDLGRVQSADTPRDITLAGATWRTREWLMLPTSTAVQPLAYVDKERAPVVVARASGAGRIVLVAAVDAWRWRADPGVTWTQGWQTLFRRLAVDVPPPVAVTTWVTGAGAERVLQVEARIRPDVLAAGLADVVTVVDVAGERESLRLLAVQDGRWRGATRIRQQVPHRVVVAARNRRGVVTSSEAVVHVHPIQSPATWRDVMAHQQQRRAVAATDAAALARAVAELRGVLVGRDGPRWYLTRTWWYAALVLAALGTEWILRRARRLP